MTPSTFFLTTFSEFMIAQNEACLVLHSPQGRLHLRPRILYIFISTVTISELPTFP